MTRETKIKSEQDEDRIRRGTKANNEASVSLCNADKDVGFVTFLSEA